TFGVHLNSQPGQDSPAEEGDSNPRSPQDRRRSRDSPFRLCGISRSGQLVLSLQSVAGLFEFFGDNAGDLLKLGTVPFKPLLPGSRSMTAGALTDKLGELHSVIGRDHL